MLHSFNLCTDVLGGALAVELLATCRAATDKRIELDRQKRDAIEALKKAELDAERNQVTSWQSNLAATGNISCITACCEYYDQDTTVSCLQMELKVTMRKRKRLQQSLQLRIMSSIMAEGFSPAKTVARIKLCCLQHLYHWKLQNSINLFLRTYGSLIQVPVVPQQLHMTQTVWRSKGT